MVEKLLNEFEHEVNNLEISKGKDFEGYPLYCENCIKLIDQIKERLKNSTNPNKQFYEKKFRVLEQKYHRIKEKDCD